MYKVLIVDDEPQARRFLSVMIPTVDPRWEVVGEAANGMEALALYKQFKPDLVLTDIRMPEMDGLALCQTLAQAEPPPQLAIVSGYDEFQYAKDAIRFGVSEYLLKPLTRKELTSFLDKQAHKLSHVQHQSEQLQLLEHLSAEYRKELMRNFLHAALDNGYVRVQTLQPLLHQMHVQDMQAVWCVMNVCADVTGYDGYEQWAQDRYLLLRLLRQLTEEKLNYGYVLEANDGTPVVCVNGENEEQVQQRTQDIKRQAQELCRAHFSVTLSMCQSAAKLDALQMHEARREADYLFPLVALHGSGSYLYAQHAEDKRAQALSMACNQLVEAWQKMQPVGIAQSVPLFCATLAEGSALAGVRMLLYRAHMKHCPHLQALEKQLLALASKAEVLCADELLRVFVHQEQAVDLTSGEKLVADAIELIRQNLAQPISLGYIADRLLVSATHLSRVFHAGTGESYINYVTRERMERAGILLLDNPAMKINTVAEQTGYYNIQHFCYVFKKYWNMTPTQYRNTHLTIDTEA